MLLLISAGATAGGATTPIVFTNLVAATLTFQAATVDTIEFTELD